MAIHASFKPEWKFVTVCGTRTGETLTTSLRKFVTCKRCLKILADGKTKAELQ